MKAFLTLAALIFANVSSAAESVGLPFETRREASRRWGKHLVPVQVWLQKWEGRFPTHFYGATVSDYKEKRPYESIGLAVDERTIWLPDLGMDERFVARMTAGQPPQPANLESFLLGTPGCIVRTVTPLPEIEPIQFAPAPKQLEQILSLHAEFLNGRWCHTLKPAASEYRHGVGAEWLDVLVGALILDRELRPVGFCLSDRLGIEKSPDVWLGLEISAQPTLNFDDLDAVRKAVWEPLRPLVPTVWGSFRREEEEPEGRRRSFHRMRGDADDSPSEFLTSGIVVGPNRILVHHGLDRESAVRLERIVVRFEGEERAARFAGAFRQFHAFLIEVEGAPLTARIDLASPGGFSLSQPLFGACADHSTARRRELLEFNRVKDFVWGYRAVLEPILQRFPRPGTIMLSPSDRSIQGVVIEVNREDELEFTRQRGRSSDEIDLRLVTIPELRHLLDGGAAIDPRLVPGGPEKEKEVVWFGADFQSLTRELAKSQGVEIPTRGGEVGIIVLAVHPGAPAQRVGLDRGDILLSIRQADEPEPHEIQSRMEMVREEFHPMAPPEDLPEEMIEEYLANAGPPWRSPRNSLTEKLTHIGVGQRVELVFLRAGQEKRAWLPLEVAPADFESARKLKIEILGLTVKDLTYEVRSHYRLAPDAPGVVVAKVEPGEKAAIAKVLPYEILVSVNRHPIRGIDELKQVLDAFAGKDDGDRTLELKLDRLGKSRLVRIRL